MARPRGRGRGGLAPRRPQFSWVARTLRLAEEDCRSASSRIRQAGFAHVTKHEFGWNGPDAVGQLGRIADNIASAAVVEELHPHTIEEMMRDSALEQAAISEELAERRLAERADLDPADGAGRRRKESLAREHEAVAAAAEEFLRRGREQPG